MIEFQVSTKHTGQHRTVKVMVYDTLEELKRASRKRDGFFGWQQESAWYAQMAAVTQSHVIERDDTVIPCVTIRLSKDNLLRYPTEIITHECAHAAIFLYRFDRDSNLPGETVLKDIDDQEQLCYLVGEISRKVVNRLYARSVL